MYSYVLTLQYIIVSGGLDGRGELNELVFAAVLAAALLFLS